MCGSDHCASFVYFYGSCVRLSYLRLWNESYYCLYLYHVAWYVCLVKDNQQVSVCGCAPDFSWVQRFEKPPQSFCEPPPSTCNFWWAAWWRGACLWKGCTSIWTWGPIPSRLPRSNPSCFLSFLSYQSSPPTMLFPSISSLCFAFHQLPFHFSALLHACLPKLILIDFSPFIFVLKFWNLW